MTLVFSSISSSPEDCSFFISFLYRDLSITGNCIPLATATHKRSRGKARPETPTARSCTRSTTLLRFLTFSTAPQDCGYCHIGLEGGWMRWKDAEKELSHACLECHGKMLIQVFLFLAQSCNLLLGIGVPPQMSEGNFLAYDFSIL